MSTVIDSLQGSDNVAVNNITANTGTFQTVQTVNATSYNFTDDLTIHGTMYVGNPLAVLAAKRKSKAKDMGKAKRVKTSGDIGIMVTPIPPNDDGVLNVITGINAPLAAIGEGRFDSVITEALVCTTLTATNFVLPTTMVNTLNGQLINAVTANANQATFKTLTVVDPFSQIAGADSGRVHARVLQASNITISPIIQTDSIACNGFNVEGGITTVDEMQCGLLAVHNENDSAQFGADIGIIGLLTASQLTLNSRLLCEAIVSPSIINRLECHHTLTLHNNENSALLTTDNLTVTNAFQTGVVSANTVEALAGAATIRATYIESFKVGEVGGTVHATNLNIDEDAEFHNNINVDGDVNATSATITGAVTCGSVVLSGLGGINAGLGGISCGNISSAGLVTGAITAAACNVGLVTCLGLASPLAGITASSFTSTGAISGTILNALVGVESVGPVNCLSTISSTISMQSSIGSFGELNVGAAGATITGNCIVGDFVTVGEYLTVGQYVTIGGAMTCAGMVSFSGDLDVGDVVTCQDLIAVGDVTATNIGASTFILSGHAAAFVPITSIVNATTGYVTITTSANHELLQGEQVHITDSNCIPNCDGYRIVSEVVSPTVYRVPATTLSNPGTSGKSYKTGESRVNGGLVADTLTVTNAIVCDDIDASNTIFAPLVYGTQFANAEVTPTFTVSSTGAVVADSLTASNVNATTITVSTIQPTATSVLLDGDVEISGTIALPSWAALSLTGGFSNYSVLYDDAAYVIDALGKVNLRGLIGGGAMIATGTGTHVATLPPGFRPTKNKVLNTHAMLNTSAIIFVTVFVYASGDIRMIAQTAGTVTWVSLDTLSFYK